MSAVTVMFVFTDPSQFVPLTGGAARCGLCTPVMALIDPRDEVAISGAKLDTPVVIDGKSYDAYPTGDGASPTALTVHPGKAPKFQFNVQDNSNPAAVGYYLGGIALKSLASGNGSSKAGEAGDVFNAIDVAVDASTGATTLTVQDNNKAAKDSSASYEFWVLVQNSAGDVGLIDPRIVNTN